MSFSISVESIIMRNTGNSREILLVKRAPDCKVAPGVWNVPAGKVKLLETTRTAVERETLEETQLPIKIIKLITEHAFEVKVGNEIASRNMFTYLTESTNPSDKVVINHEHTDFKWVSRDELDNGEYASLMPRLKECILLAFTHES